MIPIRVEEPAVTVIVLEGVSRHAKVFVPVDAPENVMVIVDR